MTSLGRAKEHMKKVGSEEKTALVSCILPAWFKKEEIPDSLLSHLFTMGKKSCAFGPAMLKGKLK